MARELPSARPGTPASGGAWDALAIGGARADLRHYAAAALRALADDHGAGLAVFGVVARALLADLDGFEAVVDARSLLLAQPFDLL